MEMFNLVVTSIDGAARYTEKTIFAQWTASLTHLLKYACKLFPVYPGVLPVHIFCLLFINFL